MELLVSNLLKSVRQERFQDRDFLIAPITLIVPGVLNGSQGAQFYPLTELKATVDAWNGMPMLLGHPKGESGRSPKVIEQTGLGTVFNATVNGKLVAEGWFDIEKTNRLDNRLIPLIRSGGKVEVSTGLHIESEENPGVENGVQYEGIARHHRPDHLAVLIDSTGACSVGDGCGVNNKQDPNNGDNTMSLSETERKQKVDNLIANCKCWKEEDREELMKAPDRSLGLYETALNKTRKVEEHEKTIAENKEKQEAHDKLLKAAQEGFKAGNDQWSLNEEGKWVKKETQLVENKETKDPEPLKLEDLPEEVQNKLARFDKREATDKAELITKMVAHLTENERQAAGEQWDKYDLETLQEMASSVIREPAKKTTNQEKPDYTGQSVAHNRKQEYTPEPLGIPVMNFEPEE